MRASSDLPGPRASRPLFWECQWVWLERDRWSWFVGLPMRVKWFAGTAGVSPAFLGMPMSLTWTRPVILIC